MRRKYSKLDQDGRRRRKWFKPFFNFCVALLYLYGSLCGAQNFALHTTSDLPDAPQPNNAALTANARSDQDSTRPATLKSFPADFVRDEFHIVTSPARIRKKDLKWLLPLTGATAAALATDTYTMRNVVSKDPAVNNASNTASDVLRGIAIGIPVLMFGTGHLTHNETARETGLLAGEAMIDAYVFDEALKFVTLRERPNTNNARGHFFTGDSVPDPSFVSGHSIATWSSAAVLASRYNRPWQQTAIYALASGASFTRVLGRDHFPTDALLGSAAGWLIGRYIYRTHRHAR